MSGPCVRIHMTFKKGGRSCRGDGRRRPRRARPLAWRRRPQAVVSSSPRALRTRHGERRVAPFQLLLERGDRRAARPLKNVPGHGVVGDQVHDQPRHAFPKRFHEGRRTVSRGAADR